MADKLGFDDVKEYGNVETGRRRLTLELLESIAEIFEMTVIGLLSFDEKAFFNHCTQQHVYGSHNTYHEASAEERALLHARVKHLEEEVSFLRRQLEIALGQKPK